MSMAGILLLMLSLVIPRPSLASEYVDNGDGTVTDQASGLIWQQPHEHEQRTWKQAVNYCNNLTLGDSNNWRLPAVDELESLINKDRFAPSIDTHYFNDTISAYFWSTSSDEAESDHVWIVGFNSGHVSTEHKELRNYARCVR